ncbi:MAG: PKD domain-containing protein [Myxococcota bacterium]|nr:PKD domain-containing protein [Myxococcota bacterium]
MILWALALWACGSEEASAPTSADAGVDIVVPVGEPVSFDGSGSEGESALWSFGDGSTSEGFVSEHVYSTPGRYSAVLQVTGADGLKKTDSVRVVAHLTPAETPPVWSSSLAVHPTTGAIWAVNPEGDSVAVIDPESRDRVLVPTCGGPRTVAIDAATNRVLIACDSGDALDVMDASTLEQVNRIQLSRGARPYGVVARDGVWWAGLQGAQAVVRVDESGVVERVDGVPDPRALVLDPDGTLFATRWRSPDEQGWVSRVRADGIALALDTTADSDTTSGGVPTQLDGLSMSPDGGSLYVPAHQANVRRGDYLSGQPLTFETTVRAVLRVIEDGRETDRVAKLFDEKGHANFALPSLLGDLIYVLHPGTQTVSVLDAYSGVNAGSILEVGHTPTALGLSPNGETLYVHAWLDREVVAFDVTDLSSATARLFTVRTLEDEPLSPEVLSGKRVFHSSADPRMAKSGYISCAHCHPDGRDDGVVWDFSDRGEGLRNTTSMEGIGSLKEGPLHWTGNFDEIQDFEEDIREAFGGLGFLSEEEWRDSEDALGEPKVGRSAALDDLASYVMSLVDFPVSPFDEPLGGEEAFLEAGCDGCHPAPDYTDSSVESFQRHDVGTWTEASGQRRGDVLDGFDTPTLRGVHATAPYLHDGSAERLEEAIWAHDAYSEMSEDTVQLIAEFVRSL